MSSFWLRFNDDEIFFSLCWIKFKVLELSVFLQLKEEQQDVFLLQFPGLHLRTGPHHLRHAHLQTRTGTRRGQRSCTVTSLYGDYTESVFAVRGCSLLLWWTKLIFLPSAARSALPGPGLRRLPRHCSADQRRAHRDVQVSNHDNHTAWSSRDDSELRLVLCYYCCFFHSHYFVFPKKFLLLCDQTAE